METTLQFGPAEIEPAIERLAAELTPHLPVGAPFGLLGIANGGVPFARRLGAALEKAGVNALPLGVIDVVFSRDDVALAPIPKTSLPTNIPFDVDGATVILADDVIFSGRTARAALEELFHHGRPARVMLVTLFDRGGRKLPLQPDLTGFVKEVPAVTKVRVMLADQPSDKDGIYFLPTAQS